MTSGSGASVRPSPYVARNVVVADVRLDGLQPLTDRRVDPGVDERDPPLVEVAREELELRTVRASVEHEVVEHRAVVREEVVLDDFALVAEAENELVVTPRRVVAHDVPEDRLAADLDHRLGDALGLLAHAHADATAEDHDFHLATPELLTAFPLQRVDSPSTELRSARRRRQLAAWWGSSTVAAGIGTMSSAPHPFV